MKFQYIADKKYFSLIFCGGDIKKLNGYNDFFDFRDPVLKRAEFQRNKNEYLKVLMKKYGKNCSLGLHKQCTRDKNLVVDHFIPLSSNQLNKEIRKMKPKNGRKVPSQSFGSNNLDNLILACAKCNAYKKSKIPTAEMWGKINK